MKKAISLLLVLSNIFSLCIGSAYGDTVSPSDASASADTCVFPEGTAIYKPSCAMFTDFGTFVVLDAGFTKQAQSIITTSTRTSIVDGKSQTIENHNVGYYSAKDGMALFAVKGVLYNNSSETLRLDALQPQISFGTGSYTKMYGYPAVSFGKPEASLLESGGNVEIVFACTSPEELYAGDADIFFELAGGSLGFLREDLPNYNSVGFTINDGVIVGSITEEKAPDNSTVDKELYRDELTVEDVDLSFDSTSHSYIVRVKIRNNGIHTMRNKFPDEVSVQFQFLDEKGDALSADANEVTFLSSMGTIAEGQAGWSPGYTKVSSLVVDKAKYISFPSYSLWFIAINDNGSSKTARGEISEPLVIDLDDILPNRKGRQEQGAPVSLDAASIEFMDTLPSSISSSSAYLGARDRFDFSLGENEVFAEIKFSLTNLSKHEIEINDLYGDFVVILNFDNGFTYRSDETGFCIFKSGNTVSVQNDSTRVGSGIGISPLVTKEITLYLPCAKAVGTMTDRSLVLSVVPQGADSQQVDYTLR